MFQLKHYTIVKIADTRCLRPAFAQVLEMTLIGGFLLVAQSHDELNVTVQEMRVVLGDFMTINVHEMDRFRNQHLNFTVLHCRHGHYSIEIPYSFRSNSNLWSMIAHVLHAQVSGMSTAAAAANGSSAPGQLM